MVPSPNHTQPGYMLTLCPAMWGVSPHTGVKALTALVHTFAGGHTRGIMGVTGTPTRMAPATPYRRSAYVR